MKKLMRKFLAVGLIISTFAGTNAQPQWLIGLATMVSATVGVYNMAHGSRAIRIPQITPASPTPWLRPEDPGEESFDWKVLKFLWNHKKSVALSIAALVGMSFTADIIKIHDHHALAHFIESVNRLRQHQLVIPSEGLANWVVPIFLHWQKVYKHINPQEHRELMQYGLQSSILHHLPDYIESFIDTGANANTHIPHLHGESYLQYAISVYADDNQTPLATLLMHGNIDQNAIHQEFRTAVQNPRQNAMNLPIVLLGGMENETLNMAYADGQTPMLLASHLQRNDIVDALILRGVHTTQEQLNLALIRACETDNVNVATMFINAGAQPTARTVLGDTALLRAVTSNHQAIITILLPRLTPPDITTQNNAGDDVLTLSLRAGNCSALLPAFNQHAQFSPAQLNRALLLACEVSNNSDVVRELIAAGAQVNTRDAEGNTPLLVAAAHGREQIIQHLLPLLSPENKNAINNAGRGAFHLARLRRDDQNVENTIEVLLTLTNAGVRPNPAAAAVAPAAQEPVGL